MSTNKSATSNISNRPSAGNIAAGVVPRVIAGCLALAGFTIAVLGGLFAGNPATLVLTRALIAMVLCYPVGYVIGLMCDRVIRQHMDEYAAKAASTPEQTPGGNDPTTSEQDEEEIIVV